MKRKEFLPVVREARPLMVITPDVVRERERDRRRARIQAARLDKRSH